MNPIGAGWAGPTLLVAGSEEQQQRWLPGILDGSEIWCQLFSEPEAGSDLASLARPAPSVTATSTSSTGRRCGRRSRTSRTSASCSRAPIPTRRAQEGITYFVVDMRSPGIEVRPLVQMTGTHEFNEVFFADVRVPAANVVGVEHDGWRLAKVTLGNERVSLSGEGALWGRGPTAGDVHRDRPRAGAAPRPPVAAAARRAVLEAEVLRLIRLRTLSARLRGLEPGPEASVRKAISDEHGQHVMAMAKALAGTHGMLADRGPVRFGRRRHVGLRLPLLAARSRSAAARARCSATSSARRSSACRDSSTRRRDVARTRERSEQEGDIREAARPSRSPTSNYVPGQKPTLLAMIVPLAHRRSGSSWEKTPFGLAQPGTTHACTIHTVFFMKVPCTASHCAR